MSQSAGRSRDTLFRVCFTGTATIDTNTSGAIPDAADYRPLTIISESGCPAGNNCLLGTISAGDTTPNGGFGIRVKGDTVAESNETVIATLSLRVADAGVTLAPPP